MAAGRLFVYGTLRPGAAGEAARRLAREAHHLGRAEIDGDLLLVGRYPGLVSGTGRVTGDVFELANPSASLSWLDEYEGPEFRRGLCRVRLSEGGGIEAWVYRYQGEVTGLPRIPGGDFLRAD